MSHASSGLVRAPSLPRGLCGTLLGAHTTPQPAVHALAPRDSASATSSHLARQRARLRRVVQRALPTRATREEALRLAWTALGPSQPTAMSSSRRSSSSWCQATAPSAPGARTTRAGMCEALHRSHSCRRQWCDCRCINCTLLLLLLWLLLVVALRCDSALATASAPVWRGPAARPPLLLTLLLLRCCCCCCCCRRGATRCPGSRAGTSWAAPPAAKEAPVMLDTC